MHSEHEKKIFIEHLTLLKTYLEETTYSELVGYQKDPLMNNSLFFREFESKKDLNQMVQQKLMKLMQQKSGK